VGRREYAASQLVLTYYTCDNVPVFLYTVDQYKKWCTINQKKIFSGVSAVN
jgi:hypothetical protein